MASIAIVTGQFPSFRQTQTRSLSHRQSRSFSVSFSPNNVTFPRTQIISQSLNHSPKPGSSIKPVLRNLALGAAAGTLLGLACHNSPLNQGGNSGGAGGAAGGGGNGGGGGGGGGGGFWSFWKKFLSQKANAVENKSEEYDSHGLPVDIDVQLNKLDGFKKYKLSDILFFDKSSQSVVGSDDSFFDMISLKRDGVYTKAQLQKELESLTHSGVFEKVELVAKTKPDGTIGVNVSFLECTWDEADRFTCINVGKLGQTKPVDLNEYMSEREKEYYMKSHESDYKRRMKKGKACKLSDSVQNEIVQMLSDNDKVSARLLRRIQDRIQKWYNDEGYVCARVVNFGNLNTRELVCEVMEGDITDVVIRFEDKLGNIYEGKTQSALVMRQIPKQLQQGKAFNIEAGKQALRNLNSLSLFSNIEVFPRPDEKKEGGIVVEIKLKESKQKSTEVEANWSIVPGGGILPTLASIQPGGSVSFEHRNIEGLNRSIHGSVTSSNLINHQDDLAFNLEYVHPYLDGVHKSRDRTLRTSCFNSRKLSPVFTAGPGAPNAPPIWVDRAGIKTNITENFTPQSKFTYGVVMEEITARNENGDISANGSRILLNGDVSEDGPPTTLGGSGVDRMVFAQANITRDNTKFVNGTLVGDRNVFQIDQGLGIGSKFPFFNRHQLMLTKFIPLKKVEEGVGKPAPPVLVLHGRYGGCVGDLPSYDAFTLGGPYSVRGYNMGEIGAARSMVEVAAELRVPVKKAELYTFAEHGNDLGTSKDVKGNPTRVYMRKGHGSSCGVGVKLGPLRVEYVIDGNSRTGTWHCRYGERF